MVKKKQMGKIAAMLYVFLIFVTSDSLMLLVASAILVLGFLMSNGRKVVLKGNSYFYIEMIFIAYCLFQTVIGIAVLKDVSWSTTRRLLINCVDEILLFNILIRFGDVEDAFNTLIYPYVAGIVLIIFLQIRSGNLFLGRLSTGLEDGMSYHFLGLTINAGAATLVGHCAVCAFAFSVICYYGNKNKKYAILAMIALAGLVLSSSRKALVVATALIIIVPVLRVHNRKRIQKMIGAVVLVAMGIILIMRVPVFYNLVGIRMERMFKVLITGETIDNSMNVRNNLRTMAWNAFLQRPIEGWGANSFRKLFNNGSVYSHCNYLELLVGTGIIGTSVFLLKYVYIFKRAVVCIKTKIEVNRFYCKCLVIWLLLVWVMEYWQVSYYNERMIVHYILVLVILEKIRIKGTVQMKTTIDNNG